MKKKMNYLALIVFCIFALNSLSYAATPPTYVDLGLPSGNLWATTNIGATSPEKYGNLYAWGETETKSFYNNSNYTRLDIGGVDISKTQYDVAYTLYGGNWQTPSEDDFKELVNNCTWTWTTRNGIRGYNVSRNGKSIFLPIGGRVWDNEIDSYDLNCGCYWSSTGYDEYSTYSRGYTSAYQFFFTSTLRSYSIEGNRGYGCPIRPVLKPNDVRVVSQGSCGTNVKYVLYDNGLLDITGSGAMANYSSSAYVPWYNDKNKVERVKVRNGVTRIGSSAFSACSNLLSVDIPASVTSIGSGAFWRCTNLTSVKIPNSVTSIEYGGFKECGGLLSVELSNAISIIDESSFEDCTSLQYIIIPNSVQSIEESAFDGCRNLLSVVIPSSVKEIGSFAFSGCSKLSDVIFLGESPVTISSKSFSSYNTLHVKKGYKSAFDINYWKLFSIVDDCEIKLDNTSLSIDKGNNATLAATVTPSMLDQTVTWTSSNNKIATVDDSGVVTAVIKGNATITATAVGGDLIATCEVDVVSDEIELTDGEPYVNEEDKDVPLIRYTRTFSASSVNKWQALCIPFSIDKVSEDYVIGEILTFCPMKDTNGDGSIDGDDENYLIISPCKSGKTDANVPYMIKPKKSGDIIFTAENCKLHAASAGELHFSTTKTSYDVYGLLQNSVVATPENKYYYMTADGAISHRETGSTTVKPNRWYMTVTPKKYGGGVGDEEITSYANEIKLFTIGEDMDEETAIRLINGGYSSVNASKEGIYNLNGMRMNDAEKFPRGIYIMNGKKVIIK